eukprot:COSAG02_NODE_17109_length_1027_cov_10.716595_1_plen_194_part_01
MCAMMGGEPAGERDRLVVPVASLECEAATVVAGAREGGGERQVEPWCTVEEARAFFWFTLLLLASGVVLRAVDDAHDECLRVDCGPHGSCSGGRCVCEGGYSGESCQIYDECFGVDCGPHGSCSGGRCVCEGGYSGESCQIYDECFGIDCSLHGSCSGGRCVCEGGYSGESCQTHDAQRVMAFGYNGNGRLGDG